MMLSGQTVRPVTVALQLFIGEFTVQWGILTAGGTLIALPVTILFLFIQRRLVGGLTGRSSQSMTNRNAIGVISMFYARPFERAHFVTFERIKRAGADVVELLVPEPDELDLEETRAAAMDAGLAIVLAARVNLSRDMSSSDDAAHKAGVEYLERCVDVAAGLGATIVGGPLFGAPLVFAGRAPHPVVPRTSAAVASRPW